MKRRLYIGGSCFAAVAATFALAVGSVTASASNAAAEPAHSAVPALQAPLAPADAEALARFQEEQTDSELIPDPTLPSNGADLTQARPAEIPGSSLRAWVAPAGDRVCVYAAMASGGYGIECPTLSEVDAGLGVSIVARATGEQGADVTVVALVPAGGTAPTVIEPGGVRTPLPAKAGVAAGILPASDSIETGAGTADLAEFVAAPTLDTAR